MSARVRMLARVLIRRAIAAQGHAALLTGAEMNPRGADFHTLLALAPLRLRDLIDGTDVFTSLVHYYKTYADNQDDANKNRRTPRRAATLVVAGSGDGENF